MTKDIRTIPHRAATAEEEDSIPTQLHVGPAWTQNRIFCQDPDFYIYSHIFVSTSLSLYLLRH
jgi:hypothetical protein